MQTGGDGSSTGRELVPVDGTSGTMARYVPMLHTFSRAQEFLTTEYGQRIHGLLLQLGLGDLGKYFDPASLHISEITEENPFDLDKHFLRLLEEVLEGICPHRLDEQQELPLGRETVFMGALLRDVDEGLTEETYTNIAGGNNRCVDIYDMDGLYIIIVTDMVTGEYRHLTLVKGSDEDDRYVEYSPYDADGDNFPNLNQVILAHLLSSDDLKGHSLTNAVLLRAKAVLGDRYMHGVSRRFLAV